MGPLPRVGSITIDCAYAVADTIICLPCAELEVCDSASGVSERPRGSISIHVLGCLLLMRRRERGQDLDAV